MERKETVVPKRTGTISMAEAEAQQERIKAIMAETSCTYGEAINKLIDGHVPNYPEPPVDDSGWNAA